MWWLIKKEQHQNHRGPRKWRQRTQRWRFMWGNHTRTLSYPEERQTSKPRKHRELPSDSRKTNYQHIISYSNSQNKETRKELWKQQRKKALTLQVQPDQVLSRPIHRNWQDRKEWRDIFNVLNWKNKQPNALHSARLFVQNRKGDKVFPRHRKTTDVCDQ